MVNKDKDCHLDVIRLVNPFRMCYCLEPRRFSFDENVRAKEDGKETTGETRFARRLYPSHGPVRFITSHSFRARLCHAKNEAPEEEAACVKSLVLSHSRVITNLYREVDFSFHPCKAQKAVSPVKRYSAEALIFTSYSVCIVGYRFTLYTHSKLSCCTRVLTIVVYFFKFSANSVVQCKEEHNGQY